MSLSAHDVQRRFCAIAALLTLLCGTGIHDWMHRSGAHADAECITESIELHSGNCNHHGPPAASHDTDCVLCKTGHQLVVLLPSQRFAAADPVGQCATLPLARSVEPGPDIPGALGARAPPVTTG